MSAPPTADATRSEALRDGGKNVDVRGSAHEAIERMGLSGRIRSLTTTEVGTRFVDAQGAAVGEFPVRPGRDGPTAELEILRGDLARSVRDLLGESTTLRFGEQIERVRQGSSTATVTLASGAEGVYDLVVVAEASSCSATPPGAAHRWAAAGPRRPCSAPTCSPRS